MEKIVNLCKLEDNLRLHRYISLSTFLYLMEFNKLVFKRIVEGWEDSWELPISKVETIDENGKVLKSSYDISTDLFGQCWTINDYSDAMWRIYSPDKQGVMISTSVGKIKRISSLLHGYIGKVIYYDDLMSGISEIKTKYKIPNFIYDAFLKRTAFKHEEEVRIVFVNDERCIENTVDIWTNYIELDIDIFDFIDEITLDPRAEPYYVRTIENLCKRYGLSINVKKSDLYAHDIKEKAGFVCQFISIDNK